jgi:hypothetical protein
VLELDACVVRAEGAGDLEVVVRALLGDSSKASHSAAASPIASRSSESSMRSS